MILVDTILLRSLDLKAKTAFDKTLLAFYIIVTSNITTFSLRSSLCFYFADQKLPGFREINLLDKLAAFVNARACACIESLLFTLNKIDKIIYRPLFGIKSDEVDSLEHDRSTSFFCSLVGCSFATGYTRSRKILWNGELRQTLKSINLREDMFPAALIGLTFILFIYSKYDQELIRSQEAFLIVFSHFFIFLEIFNSYIFFEIYKSIYCIPSKIQSSKEVKNI